MRKYRALDQVTKQVMNDNFMTKVLDMIPPKVANGKLPSVNKTSNSMNKERCAPNSIKASAIYENIRPRKNSEKKRRLGERSNQAQRVRSSKPYIGRDKHSDNEKSDSKSNKYFRTNYTPTT